MEPEQTPNPGGWIVVDLEATCWAGGSAPERMETIEIGAVRLDADGQPTSDDFERFVRPVGEPVLSGFCRGLTGITQDEVDSADPFPVAFAAFLAWAGGDEFTWGSWGVYDLLQLRRDCARHAIEWPQGLRHHNLKQLYAVRRGSRARGPG